MLQYNISFAGAGRVAGALCRMMYQSGFKIDMIASESEKNSRLLADSCEASWSTDLKFPDSTDVIIVAVPDHRLLSVLSTLKCKPKALVAHTAGSMGLDIFPENILNRGVFYPLQTFSKDREIVFKDLPVLLEVSDNRVSEILCFIAESIESKVHFVDIEHRRMLHLAAVFVCNFSNHMLTVGKEVSSKAGLSFELLEPLIKETFLKAIENGPENSQTGPALRNDLITIEKHLELLSFSPEMQSIYRQMTESIINHYKKS